MGWKASFRKRSAMVAGSPPRWSHFSVWMEPNSGSFGQSLSQKQNFRPPDSEPGRYIPVSACGESTFILFRSITKGVPLVVIFSGLDGFSTYLNSTLLFLRTFGNEST
jgi:hypothetical protein